MLAWVSFFYYFKTLLGWKQDISGVRQRADLRCCVRLCYLAPASFCSLLPLCSRSIVVTVTNTQILV
jgi:hypothetical protein